jgi:hypothetical protein
VKLTPLTHIYRTKVNVIIPPVIERGLYCNHLVCPSVRLSICSHFRNRYLSFYWKKWFYIWYMALAWWLVPCLPFPGLPCDLELLIFAVMKTFVTDISASTGRNDFIFDMWLWHGDLYRVSPFQVYCTSTSCLPCDLRIFHLFTSFSGNECWDIYKFDTNERVGVFLARRSMQYLVVIVIDLIKLCWYLIHVTINIRMVIV